MSTTLDTSESLLSDSSSIDHIKSRIEMVEPSSPALLNMCGYCGQVRETVIQCMRCGDKKTDTESLSPYLRLRLVPAPLFSEDEIQAAKESLLVIFHPLRASRLNAKWSLRQRALICRDSKTLSSITGALTTYLNYLFETEVVTKDTHQQKVYSIDDAIETEPSSPRLISTFILEDALKELSEYDGYQERERLLNRVSRELLNEGMRVGNALLQRPISLCQIRQLNSSIKIMGDWEHWLNERRYHSLGWRL